MFAMKEQEKTIPGMIELQDDDLDKVSGGADETGGTPDTMTNTVFGTVKPINVGQ